MSMMTVMSARGLQTGERYPRLKDRSGLRLPCHRSYSLSVTTGRRPLRIVAGLGPLSDTVPSSPFHQVRLELALEVLQHLPYCAHVHVPFYRDLLIGCLLSLPAKRHPPSATNAATWLVAYSCS